MPEALRGLYARRDALRARIGDRIASLGSLNQAMAASEDDTADRAMIDLELKLRAVEVQIQVYERTGGGPE